MSRPKCCRTIGWLPERRYFSPAGLAVPPRDEVALSLDEFEALRLAHYEGMYHEQAAAMMHVSRATFGRIIESAQHKIADFLVHGKALRITGGEIFVAEANRTPCAHCERAGGPCAARDGGRCPHCRKTILKERGVRHEGSVTIKTEPHR